MYKSSIKQEFGGKSEDGSEIKSSMDKCSLINLRARSFKRLAHTFLNVPASSKQCRDQILVAISDRDVIWSILWPCINNPTKERLQQNALNCTPIQLQRYNSQIFLTSSTQISEFFLSTWYYQRK